MHSVRSGAGEPRQLAYTEREEWRDSCGLPGPEGEGGGRVRSGLASARNSDIWLQGSGESEAEVEEEGGGCAQGREATLELGEGSGATATVGGGTSSVRGAAMLAADRSGDLNLRLLPDCCFTGGVCDLCLREYRRGLLFEEGGDSDRERSTERFEAAESSRPFLFFFPEDGFSADRGCDRVISSSEEDEVLDLDLREYEGSSDLFSFNLGEGDRDLSSPSTFLFLFNFNVGGGVIDLDLFRDIRRDEDLLLVLVPS